MDITKIQKLLAAKALSQPQHRFNDLYRYVRHREWLETARHDILKNTGANTPGVDGIKGKELTDTEWRTLLDDVVEALQTGAFQPMPARRVYIPKANGGLRPLGIPTIRDRVVQEVLRMLLEPIYESRFLNSSHGFRPGRSTMHAMHRVQYLSGIHNYYWVIEGDIKGCFDNIPHDRLMRVLRQGIGDERLLSLIWAFLKAGYEEDGIIHHPNTGTPQGGIVSPLLANIYLHEMDKIWQTRYGSLTQHQRKVRRREGFGNVELVRYADDFLILTNGSKATLDGLKTEFGNILNTLGLTLSPEKTLVTHVNDGLDFLGFHIHRRPKWSDPRQKALYVTPSERNIQRYKDKIRDLLATTHGDEVNKIRAVNRVVRGWGNYYRHVQSIRCRQKLDHWTYTAMWLWLGKKHGGNWGPRKLYDRYMQTNALGRKVLGYGTVHLARMGSIPTQRFYLPKGGMQNPYLRLETAELTRTNDDPMEAHTWDGTSTQKGFALIRQDLLMQSGPICHRCKQQFPQFKLAAHHVKAQQDGGKDTRRNFELLCPDCHAATPSYGGKGKRCHGEPDALKGARPVRRRGKTPS